MKLLIVGNGPAGFSLAKELHDDFEVELMDREPFPYYNKPMLSHYIAGLVEREKLFMYSEEWYEKKGIELRLGVNVRRIDVSSKKVITGEGIFDYDILVLATGARPREPDIEGREYLSTLRTLEDADRIRDVLEEEGEVTIIGGGFIGLELASNLAKAGYKSRLIHRRDTLLHLDMELSAYLKERLEEMGVEFHLNEDILKADERGILTNRGYIEGKLKVCAIGIIPNKELAVESGIRTKRGILIDENFRSSAPDVYAIGDCAEYNGIICGTAKGSMGHAKVLANLLRGRSDRYDFEFRSALFKFGDLPISIIGDTRGEGRWLEEGVKVFMKGEKMVGAVVLGDVRKGVKMERMIKESLQLI